MRRPLFQSSAFVRATKRLLKRQPESDDALGVALERLAADAFDIRLKTHKLKGDLKGFLAFSIDNELRIIFKIVEHEGAEAVLLQTVGTHDQVY